MKSVASLLLRAGLLTSIVLMGVDAVAESGLDLVPLQGGRFVMGDPAGEPDEAPKEVDVAPFRIMRLEVTNEQFAAFVAASGHLTDPERKGFGYLWDGRWRRVRGAHWRHPFGPDSSIAGRADHPVVQVSAQDAAAFCDFYDLRLPSEQEWEFAARGTNGRRGAHQRHYVSGKSADAATRAACRLTPRGNASFFCASRARSLPTATNKKPS